MTPFQTYTRAEIVPLLAATAIFVGTEFQSAWLRPDRTSLRLIHCPGAGTDGIDFSASSPGCMVCNVYGYEHAIAEHVFMVTLALNRRLFAQGAALRRGDWGDREMLPELCGRTLPILGLGHIGS